MNAISFGQALRTTLSRQWFWLPVMGWLVVSGYDRDGWRITVLLPLQLCWLLAVARRRQIHSERGWSLLSPWSALENALSGLWVGYVLYLSYGVSLPVAAIGGAVALVVFWPMLLVVLVMGVKAWEAATEWIGRRSFDRRYGNPETCGDDQSRYIRLTVHGKAEFAHLLGVIRAIGGKRGAEYLVGKVPESDDEEGWILVPTPWAERGRELTGPRLQEFWNGS